MNTVELIMALKVEGLPMLTGKLDMEGRRRAEDLLDRFEQSGKTEHLIYTLVEREQQLAMLIGKLQERASHD